jgi:hypothetical protein
VVAQQWHGDTPGTLLTDQLTENRWATRLFPIPTKPACWNVLAQAIEESTGILWNSSCITQFKKLQVFIFRSAMSLAYAYRSVSAFMFVPDFCRLLGLKRPKGHRVGAFSRTHCCCGYTDVFGCGEHLYGRAVGNHQRYHAWRNHLIHDRWDCAYRGFDPEHRADHGERFGNADGSRNCFGVYAQRG